MNENPVVWFAVPKDEQEGWASWMELTYDPDVIEAMERHPSDSSPYDTLFEQGYAT